MEFELQPHWKQSQRLNSSLVELCREYNTLLPDDSINGPQRVLTHNDYLIN